MNILHIASIDNNIYNGVPRIVPRIISAQQDAGTDRIGFLNVRKIDIEGLDCQLFPEKLSLEELPYPFNEPDLVVFHEVYYPKFLKLSKECREEGIPYIIIPHGCLTSEAQNIKKLKKRIGNELLFKRFVMGAASLQFLTKAEKKRTIFNKEGFTGPSGIVLPVRYRIFGGSISEEGRDLAKDQPTRFTYIGRIDTHIKGLDLLFKAIAEKQDYFRENSCEFNLYGPDADDSELNLEMLAEDLGVMDLININGPVAEEEKEEILLSSDIFLQTSRSEALPTGLLEALGYGIPCVVSHGTGFAGLINWYKAGFGGKNKEDISELAELLVKAAESKDLYPEMSRNERRLIEDNFERSKCATITLQKYRMLLLGNRESE